MNEKFKTPTRKRRTCWDKMRARWLENRRRHRIDPATSTAAQLVALFMGLFGRMSVPAVPTPTPYLPPPMSPGRAQRVAVARRVGIPSRYVDIVLAHGKVPYLILFEHVRRGGRSRDDAMIVLRQQAPESCRDWLDHVEQWGLWSSLLLCHVREGVDEDTDIKLLQSTLDWLRDAGSVGGPAAPAEAAADLNPMPGGSGPEDDPHLPRR